VAGAYAFARKFGKLKQLALLAVAKTGELIFLLAYIPNLVKAVTPSLCFAPLQ
jgi:hypothetical protein